MTLPIYNPHTAIWSIGKNGARELNGELTEDYIESCKQHGVGLYFTVNELGDSRNEKGHLRDARNVLRFTSLFADFDHGTKEGQMEIIESLGADMQPTTIVESGRGYHAYWEIEEADRSKISAEEWKFTQRALSRRVGSDPACSDPARLMRLPGSWHVKEGYEPSRVLFLPRKLQPAYPWSFFRFKLDTYKHDLRLEVRSSPPISSWRRPAALPSVRLSEGERHGALIKYGARLFRGVAPSEVEERRAVLKAWYVDSCMKLKESWEREVDSYVDEWLLKRELGSGS